MEKLICDFLCPVRVHDPGCNLSCISGAVVTVQGEQNSVVCLSQINLIPGEDDGLLFESPDVHRALLVAISAYSSGARSRRGIDLNMATRRGEDESPRGVVIVFASAMPWSP